MRVHSQLRKQKVHRVGWSERAEKTKAYMKDKRKDDGKDKRDNLVVGQRRSKDADGNVGAAQEEQPRVRTPDASVVEVACGRGEVINHSIIYQRGHKRKENQQQACKI